MATHYLPVDQYQIMRAALKHEAWETSVYTPQGKLIAEALAATSFGKVQKDGKKVHVDWPSSWAVRAAYDAVLDAPGYVISSVTGDDIEDARELTRQSLLSAL